MIWNALERYRDHGLLLLRLGVGLGFIWYHGWDKLLGGPDRWAEVGQATGHLGLGFAPVLFGFLAALAESLGGLLIALGLFFRPAAVALACVMFTATVFHHATGIGTPAHSFKNFWLFVGLVAVGPGRFSLDHLLAGGRPREPVEAGVAGPSD